MRIHVEIDDAAAGYVLSMCLSRLKARNTSEDERVLVSHVAEAIRVGIEVARTAKYTQAGEHPPLIEPAPV